MTTWTGDPLATPLRITGHPELWLWIRPTTPRLTLFAYLELVDPGGRVRYLTEAVLDAQYRGTAERGRATRSDERRPLEPGLPTELRMVLLPTAVVVPSGWRVRLAIAGADLDTFGAPEGPGQVEVLTGAGHPSRIELPVAPAT